MVCVGMGAGREVRSGGTGNEGFETETRGGTAVEIDMLRWTLFTGFWTGGYNFGAAGGDTFGAADDTFGAGRITL